MFKNPAGVLKVGRVQALPATWLPFMFAVVMFGAGQRFTSVLLITASTLLHFGVYSHNEIEDYIRGYDQDSSHPLPTGDVSKETAMRVFSVTTTIALFGFLGASLTLPPFTGLVSFTLYSTGIGLTLLYNKVSKKWPLYSLLAPGAIAGLMFFTAGLSFGETPLRGSLLLFITVVLITVAADARDLDPHDMTEPNSSHSLFPSTLVSISSRVDNTVAVVLTGVFCVPLLAYSHENEVTFQFGMVILFFFGWAIVWLKILYGGISNFP